MAYQTLSLGLTLTIPTPGTRNWAQTLYSTTWTKISGHDHSGAGNGAQLGTNALLNLSITTGKLADLCVTTAKLADDAVTSQKIAANIAFKQASQTPSGTTATLDFNTGNTQKVILGSASGDVTLTLSNPQEGALYRIILEQGATPRGITWPASVKWPQGQVAILSAVASAVDVIELYYDGTNYLADWQVAFS